MKRITFYLDFISPYAYLAFERLPEALQGLSYSVEYRPVLFAGMLGHFGQLGPAEIPEKKAWTFRQVAWLAQRHGLALDVPALHPFNPLALLRTAVACGAGGACNRYVAETIFRHVWRGGADAGDPARLAQLMAQLPAARNIASEEVKAELKANTDAAIEAGVFGVPSVLVDGRVFWGLDSLEMLRECMGGSPWFDGPAWMSAGTIPGLVRNSKT